MLIDDKEALTRLNSPLNLLNRISRPAKSRAMDLFVPRSADNQTEEKKSVPFNPFEKREVEETKETKETALIPSVQTPQEDTSSPTLDTLLDNADGQLKLAAAHDKALNTLTTALDHLQNKLDDVKADKLPSVIASTAKVIEGIRKERNDAAKAKNGREVHLHFYTPVQRKLEEYDVIEVG